MKTIERGSHPPQANIDGTEFSILPITSNDLVMIIETSPSWKVQVIAAEGNNRKLSVGSRRPFARTQISYRQWWVAEKPYRHG
jgi:hypothetical protein